MKKLLVLLCFFNAFTIHAQDGSFEEITSFINENIRCCAVPFSGSDSMKVSGIEISKNGDIILSYSSKKGPLAFNLFDLYKETKRSTGIETGKGASRLLFFHLNAEKTRSIRFTNHEVTKKVHSAFLNLLRMSDTRKETTVASFQSVVNAINEKLAKWAEGKIQLAAREDGNILITSSGKRVFAFNLFELDIYGNGTDSYGMQVVPCSKKAAAELSWINFYSAGKTTAYFKLGCMPDAELSSLHQLIIQLRFLCQPSFATKPAGAVHFIRSTETVHAQNEMLLGSIRSSDKKDVGDTTLLIYSSGEGWLDKDSLPVGTWRFYAKGPDGIPYLFKTGDYSRTKASMFEVQNSDSAWVSKHHGVSFASLREEQTSIVPFIKAGSWKYFHPDGSKWKVVSYQVEKIPVFLDVMITTDGAGNDTGSSLIARTKEDRDEWISADVTEYDAQGNKFKKLQYYGFAEVYKKILYDKKGTIIKEFQARPYESTVSAENY